MAPAIGRVWISKTEYRFRPSRAQDESDGTCIAIIPDLYPPVALNRWTSEPQAVRKLVSWEDGDRFLKKVILNELSNPSLNGPEPASVVILGGPEGGWTKREQKYILELGYEAVALCDNILRAETAAIISLAIISYFWNT